MEKEEDIIALAKRTQHYCNLLIEQSDEWLSAEEGNKVMAERIAKAEEEKTKLENQ
ncbi:hypothetical protein FACS1894181_06340 [Bacteroidia bacterium]|nr:hypothetical protein FACS1894181_06340 [Bacteroidia bacterium]